jgi:hypothetical protein
MKNFTKLIPVAVLTLLSTMALGQSKKYVLFEHFTQASCGPCASQNPAFEAVYSANLGAAHHVAFHTSWPGTDPMYNFNMPGNEARTSYYGVSGVPSMQMNGSNWTGGPASVTQGMIDAEAAVGSPIEVKVTEVDNGSTRDVTVEIKTTGTAPTGNLVVRTAVVERMITYGSPPGSNGEMAFPNVFREMLPSQTGDAYTPAAIGQTVTYNYTYAIDAAYDAAEIYTLAYVQNESTKEVYNSGASTDPSWSLTSPNGTYQPGSDGIVTNVGGTVNNGGATANDFTVTLTQAGAPAGWNADFTINGNTYATTATITVAGGATEDVTINVTPDAAAAIANYTLTVENITVPTDPTATSSYVVMANVTDLIVNQGGFGDGGSYDWEPVYLSGLNAAGNTTFASTTTPVYKTISSAGPMTSVNNIYFNMGWTFPGLTDATVAELETFMDAGGNLFLAGQDIGWDTWDVANGGNGTAATQSFYTNYLHSAYGSDGSPSNASLDAIAADGIFGGVTSSPIADVYGGSGNLYPDEFTAIAPAYDIFNYNGGSGANGGVRAQINGYKVVFMGLGMEHLTAAVADEILSLSHDWFYGLVSTEEFDARMSTLGQNYPNPSNAYTTIPVSELNEDVTLQVVDYTGKVVYTSNVEAGTTQVQLSTVNLSSGMYVYTILDNAGKVLQSKTMQVVR